MPGHLRMSPEVMVLTKGNNHVELNRRALAAFGAGDMERLAALRAAARTIKAEITPDEATRK